MLKSCRAAQVDESRILIYRERRGEHVAELEVAR